MKFFATGSTARVGCLRRFLPADGCGMVGKMADVVAATNSVERLLVATQSTFFASYQ